MDAGYTPNLVRIARRLTTVALCPNCHRKMHVLKLEADIATLLAKAKP